MSTFAQYLEFRLQQHLPAEHAHRLMMPKERRYSVARTDTVRNSAVLVPLRADSERNCGITVLYVVRSLALKAHPGQIAFPGGRIQSGESIVEAAMREFQEEVDPAYPPTAVRVVGQLSPVYIPTSFFRIYPVVGFLQQAPNFTPNTEVDEIMEISLDLLLRKKATIYHRRLQNGALLSYPAWDVHRNIPLWGATAMITAELLWLYNEYRRTHCALL